MSDPEGKRPLLAATNVLGLLALPALYVALTPHLPVRHWLVDLPASFCVQAGAVVTLATLGMLLARRGRLAALFFAGMLSACLASVPPWLAATRIRSTGEAPLTVMSVNLQKGKEAHAAAAIAALDRVDPDVLFLCEMTPAWWQALRTRLQVYPHGEVREQPGTFGLALFSRLPLADLEVLPLGFDWAPAVRAVLQTPTGPVGLLAVHPPRPGTGRRCAERDRGLAAIPAALTPLPARRVVLGDFNATPWNRAFPTLLAETGLRHASGDAFRPTWPTHWPWPLRVPIDHVLVGGDLAVARVDTGAAFGSDHVPIWAELRLASEGY